MQSDTKIISQTKDVVFSITLLSFERLVSCDFSFINPPHKAQSHFMNFCDTHKKSYIIDIQCIKNYFLKVSKSGKNYIINGEAERSFVTVHSYDNNQSIIKEQNPIPV
ncbi:MAG: hypothetical protein FWH18_08575 [Marinilabiliaceae bacterium]|nr:hypothetical protein [Marinilabiliaceae bacterium]